MSPGACILLYSFEQVFKLWASVSPGVFIGVTLNRVSSCEIRLLTSEVSAG